MMEPNTLHPALPNYVGPIRGFFSCVHHYILIEWSDDIMERVRFYDAGNKPLHEMETRRRCFVYLDPTGQPWEPLVQAWQQYEQVWQPHEQVWQPHEQARQRYEQVWQPHEQARQRYEQARQRYEQAWQRYEQARQQYLPQIEAQIRALVPDLPWDGKQLVFPTNPV